MRLHRHSTSNPSKMKCHKHCHYPRLHSTHIVARRILRFVQQTAMMRVSLEATQNRISWTYSTPVSFLRLSSLVAFFDRVVCLIWRWYDERTGSRRRRGSRSAHADRIRSAHTVCRSLPEVVAAIIRHGGIPGIELLQGDEVFVCKNRAIIPFLDDVPSNTVCRLSSVRWCPRSRWNCTAWGNGGRSNARSGRWGIGRLNAICRFGPKIRTR